ncbi:MAG: nucleotidyltransferase family protein [archaeon]|nr:nucleotidyltransferase family protein [archaeon]MCR4323979.1 nucleotidyltransferase family protein [Nanoarchaeota archaeon]
MRLKTAVIIAGGKGSRLEEHTEDLPKPLVPVGGKPILERILEWLKKNGVENVVIGVAYKKEMVMSYFGDGSEFGLNIKYIEHDMNGGTEDAFKTDIEKAGIEEEDFFAMNGDQVTNLDLGAAADSHLASGAVATLVTVSLKTNFGVVDINEKNQIVHFQEKGEVKDKRMNSGIYVFNKKIKDYLSGGNIEENTFRKLCEERALNSFYHDGIWFTVNDKKELKKAEEFLNENGESILD